MSLPCSRRSPSSSPTGARTADNKPPSPCVPGSSTCFECAAACGSDPDPSARRGRHSTVGRASGADERVSVTPPGSPRARSVPHASRTDIAAFSEAWCTVAPRRPALLPHRGVTQARRGGRHGDQSAGRAARVAPPTTPCTDAVGPGSSPRPAPRNAPESSGCRRVTGSSTSRWPSLGDAAGRGHLSVLDVDDARSRQIALPRRSHRTRSGAAISRCVDHLAELAACPEHVGRLCASLGAHVLQPLTV